MVRISKWIDAIISCHGGRPRRAACPKKAARDRHPGLVHFWLFLCFVATAVPAEAQQCPPSPKLSDRCIDLSKPGVAASKCQGTSCCAGAFNGPLTALVVGNNTYGGLLRPLCNAANDASALTDKLAEQGFSVCCLINATGKHVQKGIDAAKKHMSQMEAGKAHSTRMLVYLAGHGSNQGTQDGPVGGTRFYGAGNYTTTQALCEQSEIVMHDAVNWRKSPGVHPVWVIDACRVQNKDLCAPPGEGPAQEVMAQAPKMRGTRRSLTPTETGGLSEIYSTQPGREAVDTIPGTGTDRPHMSPFMRALLTEIDLSWGRSLDDVFHVVRHQVSQTINQTPFFRHHDSSIHVAQPWRRLGEGDDCSNTKNELAKVVLFSGAQDVECKNLSLKQCLQQSQPSPPGCFAYRFLTSKLASNTQCLAEVKELFGEHFSADRCDQHMTIAALPVRRDVAPNMQVAELRSVAPLSTASPSATRGRFRGISGPAGDDASPPRSKQLNEALSSLGKQDSAEIVAEAVALEKPDEPDSAKSTIAAGQRLQIDCNAIGAVCSDQWVAVKKPAGNAHEIVHLKRTNVRIIPAASETVVIEFEPDKVRPTAASLKQLDEKAARFFNLAAVHIRLTTEATGGINETEAIVAADLRAIEVGRLLRAAGYEKQKITRTTAILAGKAEGRRVIVEFLEQ